MSVVIFRQVVFTILSGSMVFLGVGCGGDKEDVRSQSQPESPGFNVEGDQSDDGSFDDPCKEAGDKYSQALNDHLAISQGLISILDQLAKATENWANHVNTAPDFPSNATNAEIQAAIKAHALEADRLRKIVDDLEQKKYDFESKPDYIQSKAAMDAAWDKLTKCLDETGNPS